MTLEENIQSHLRQIGTIGTIFGSDLVLYVDKLQTLMQEYSKINQKPYYLPNCSSCEKYHTKPTGQRGWSA